MWLERIFLLAVFILHLPQCLSNACWRWREVTRWRNLCLVGGWVQPETGGGKKERETEPNRAERSGAPSVYHQHVIPESETVRRWDSEEVREESQFYYRSKTGAVGEESTSAFPSLSLLSPFPSLPSLSLLLSSPFSLPSRLLSSPFSPLLSHTHRVRHLFSLGGISVCRWFIIISSLVNYSKFKCGPL